MVLYLLQRRIKGEK